MKRTKPIIYNLEPCANCGRTNYVLKCHPLDKERRYKCLSCCKILKK